MPGGDRTGPLGRGPMTGRGAGFCAGDGMTGYAPAGGGIGPGFMGGRGGRGWRNRFCATGLPGWQRFGMGKGASGAPFAGTAGVGPDEREVLMRQAQALEASLEAIRARLEALEGGKKAE